MLPPFTAVFFCSRRSAPEPTLLPYTTLFRSLGRMDEGLLRLHAFEKRLAGPTWSARLERVEAKRSEEHTSELQSRQYLVCRLLLEKKNIIILCILYI